MLTKRLCHDLWSWIVPVRYGNLPKNLRIASPKIIRGAERIFFGDDVRVGPGSILKAKKRAAPYGPGAENGGDGHHFNSRIVIGDRVTATSNLHIAAHSKITIGDDVMLASNVFIADAVHGYQDADVPYKDQPMERVAPIRIGKGCWIGQNVVILPGVSIGEQSIIGANSVVTKRIPKQCIAIGAPARVVKRWDRDARKWMPVEEEERKGAEPSWQARK